MGYESKTGLNVHNHYGARNVGGATGVYRTEGSENELTIVITGETLNSTFELPVDIPAGAVVTKASAHVTEAFVLGGTTPTILFGTKDSEVTNGGVIAEASAEATGYYDLTSTLAGTWDAEAAFAAKTSVGIALGGTTPTADATVGRAVVVVKYTNVA